MQSKCTQNTPTLVLILIGANTADQVLHFITHGREWSHRQPRSPSHPFTQDSLGAEMLGPG